MQIMESSQASPCSPATFEIVRDLALVHTGPDQPMHALDHDPVRYPEQRTYFAPGNQKDLETLYAMGKVLEPRFRAGAKRLQIGKIANQGEITAEIGTLLENDENVAVNMHHASLPDSGAAFGEIYCALRENGHDFTTAVIGNCTLTFMGYEFVPGYPMPAPDALGELTENKFYTFSVSKRMLESELGDDSERLKTIKEHNILWRILFKELLSKGRVLWLVLDNATHDIEKDGVTQLAEVSDGTADLFLENDTYAVAVALGREPDRPLKVRYAGRPRRLSNHEEVHDMSREKVAALNEMFPNKSYVYEGDIAA